MTPYRLRLLALMVLTLICPLLLAQLPNPQDSRSTQYVSPASGVEVVTANLKQVTAIITALTAIGGLASYLILKLVVYPAVRGSASKIHARLEGEFARKGDILDIDRSHRESLATMERSINHLLTDISNALAKLTIEVSEDHKLIREATVKLAVSETVQKMIEDRIRRIEEEVRRNHPS